MARVTVDMSLKFSVNMRHTFIAFFVIRSGVGKHASDLYSLVE